MQQETDGSRLSKKSHSKDLKSGRSKPIRSPITWGERIGQTWFVALLGAALYWLSLPPMKFPWAGFLASAFLVSIIAKECSPTRREYWSIWLAGAVLWLSLLQGIRLAYWPLYFGWIALSLYLAVYLPLFVAMARSLHHSWYIPLPFAAATAWVGCELIRAYFVTGFAACMLAHSQTPWPWMLPIASYFGGYGVSFVVMFIGAVLYQWLSWAIWNRTVWLAARSRRFVIVVAAYTILGLAVVLSSLGSMRSHDQWLASQEPIKPLGAVLLIQENMPTQFDASIDDIVLGWQRYAQQTAKAAQANTTKEVNLIVWPESTFTGGVPWIDSNNDPALAAVLKIPEEDIASWREQIEIKLKLIYTPSEANPPKFLLGTDCVRLGSGKAIRYNAALWFDPQNRNACTYYSKQHLVMFGEYIPFASYFPSILQMIGLGSIEAGDKPMAWQLSSGATISTSICFENVLPHLIQSHVGKLTALGKSPDMLVNITNDGWFRGSSILDHHLNNAILAAVENRRPMLVAANLGISAWIDGDGRVVRSLPRMEPGWILAEPKPDGRSGWWQSVGDFPARCLAIVSSLLFLIGLAKGIFAIRYLPN